MTRFEEGITINTSNFSLTPQIADSFNSKNESNNKNEISEIKTLENMLSLVNQNDLSSLKRYFENEGKKVFDYSVSVEYSYKITK